MIRECSSLLFMRKRDAQPQGRPRSEGEGYEKRDANAKWIFGIVIGFGLDYNQLYRNLNYVAVLKPERE